MKLTLAHSTLRDQKLVLMRHTPVSFISRCIALLCVMTWFVASNHCALAGLMDRTVKKAPIMQCEHCPSKDDHGGKSDGLMLACCKGIKATDPSGTIVRIACDISISMLAVVVALVEVPLPAFTADFNDTGPPRTVAFAAAVLARSFQSHAPPFVG